MKRFCLPAVASFMVVAGLTFASIAQAAFPGKNGKIAFGSGGNIWTMNPDGSGRTQLGAGTLPSWSPDGTKILFERSGSGGTQVHVMNADGSGVQQVTNRAGGAYAPDWFPDGTRIVYVGNSGIVFTANPDGTSEQTFSYSTSSDFYVSESFPAWTPDGTEIAIFGEGCGDESCGQLAVFTVRSDGTGYRCCWGAPIDFNSRHDWSPDGRYLVAQDLLGTWSEGLGRTERPRRPGGFLHIVDSGTNSAWAPDGTKIVYDDLGSISERYGELFLANPDGSGETNITNTPGSESTPDWQPIPVNAYVRPKGATPIRASLVPAYATCAAPNREHGPPLAFGSCNPPAQASDELTVGTADSNGKSTSSDSKLTVSAQPGVPSTPADEADVRFEAAINDVYRQVSLSEYTGELRAEVTLRITDKLNTPHPGGPGAGTVSDLSFGFTIPCAVTPDPARGSLCAITTTADAVSPGSVAEGRRTVWQVEALRIDDGGADEDGDSPADNTVFMRPGVFVP